MSPSRGPVRRNRDGSYTLDLSDDWREALKTLAGSMASVWTDGDPAADASLSRLFPPAYADDPLRNLEFEMGSGAGHRAEGRDAAAVMASTADHERLTQDEAVAWMQALNHARLLLGSRLGVEEDSDARDFAADPESAESYELYVALTGLLGEFVEELPPG